MSFRIEEWQVMQAHRNGARIESTSRIHPKWVLTTEPLWNWEDNDYRIVDLTTDGMRLDELVDKFPLSVSYIINEGFKPSGDIPTRLLINFIIKRPDLICKLKVHKKEKKLRPWTMEEFEKHRDEWFVSLVGVNRKIECYDHRCVYLGKFGAELTYTDLMERFTLEDGSPCGVLE